MYTLAAYFHDLNPFIWRIYGDFGIRWYGAAYLAGFAVAYFILLALARRRLILIPQDRVADAMLWLIGGTLIGGRIGYALFYDEPPFHLLTSFSSTPPYWNLLAINKGGMASHGGMIGLICACWRISRGWTDETGRIVGRCPFLHVTDCAALVAPFGIFFGRIANFVNGELLGKIVTPPGVEGPWWSVQYPQELDWAVQGPSDPLPMPGPRLVQTPEQWSKILDLAQAAAPGRTLGAGLDALSHGSGKYAAQLRPLISSRHPTQFYQAVAEGVILAVILWLVWAKPRKPGVIGALFLILYGVGRVATELVRLPDAHLAVQQILGLSRGQWLSVGMILGGIVVTWIAQTRPAPALGGWLKSK